MGILKQFIVEHFDKLLLSFMFMWMVHVVLLLGYWHASNEAVSWARELASGFQGALLGLITGVAIGRRLVQPEPKSPPTDEGKV